MPINFTDSNELRVIGENPWMMVFDDPEKPASTHVSVWRALMSPAGPGNALFWRSELTNGEPRIYADNPGLARWLQAEIIGGNMPYKDPSLPIVAAEFSRSGALPWYLTERVVAPGEVMEFTWFDFLEAFSGRSDPDEGETHGHSACYIPAREVRVTLNGVQAKGSPLPRERDGYQWTTCFLAVAESWVRVR
jgi:hypothetical protein